MLRLSSFAVGFAALFGCTDTPHPTTRVEQLGLVRQLAEEGVEKGYWPGIAWAQVTPGAITFIETAGFADIESRRAFTADTTMSVASISKVVLGLTAAHAIDAGHLNLDDPLQNTVTTRLDFPDGLPRTFRHLTTHTSGIEDNEALYADSEYALGEHVHPKSMETLLASFLTAGGSLYDPDNNFASTAPGTTYRYSNLGATLAAQAIADATGEPFAEYSHRTVRDKLGIDGFWGPTRQPDRHSATLYQVGGDDFSALPVYAIPMWPAGQFNTSVEGLATMLATVMGEGKFENRQVWPTRIVDFLTASHANTGTVEDMSFDTVGLFWSTGTFDLGSRDIMLAGHDGGILGVNTKMFAAAEGETGFVLMMNSDLGSRAAVRQYETIALHLATLR